MPKNPFRDRAKKLRRLTERALEDITLQVIKRNESYALDLNRAQLEAGKDREGFSLPAYSKPYAKKKGRKIPNLKLTGAFWRAFKLKADKFPLEITSTDEKTNDLIKRYGQNIFNLSEANAKKFARYIQPQITEALAKFIRQLGG